MNSPVNPGEIFYAPSHISWVQDRACLLLVNEATQATAQLVGFPAALWDWLLLGYRYETLIQFAAAWFALPPEQIEPVLRQQLHEWWVQGFLLGEDVNK